jgi:hypothetical protein
MKSELNFSIRRPVWLIAVIATTSLTLAGCAHERRMMLRAPGSYETNDSYTDSKGTTTSNKTNTDVSIDSRGRRKQSVTSETSRDPRGLMNKTTTKKSTTTTEE